jgi:hypothetical protein
VCERESERERASERAREKEEEKEKEGEGDLWRRARWPREEPIFCERFSMASLVELARDTDTGEACVSMCS